MRAPCSAHPRPLQMLRRVASKSIARLQTYVSLSPRPGDLVPRETASDIDPPWLTGALTRLGHSRPTSAQLLASPAIASGVDVVLAAETGSGKTLAYLVPLVLRALESRNQEARTTLVLCPSVILAQQVLRDAKELLESLKDCYTDGERAFAHGIEIASVNSPGAAMADLLVATPASMRQKIQSLGKHRRKEAEAAFAARVRALVVDEADMVLTGGYRRDLEHLVGILRRHDHLEQVNVRCDAWDSREGDDGFEEGFEEENSEHEVEHEETSAGIEAMPGRQYIFVGATIPHQGKKSVAAMIKKNFPNAVWIHGPRLHMQVESLEQRWYETRIEERMELLKKILQETTGHRAGKRTLIFVNKSTSAASLTTRLQDSGFCNVFQFHKDITLEERMTNLELFAKHEESIMVATDAASRGLDIPEVTHVVQADFAQSAVDYLHRIGRTARAGKEGLVSSLFMDVNKPLVETVRSAVEAGVEVEAAFSRNRGFRKKVRKYGKVDIHR